jgi:hypothetical protein
MKVLSFDVGIVNLAYCIFDTSSCKINHWEVISLESNVASFNKLYINLITELDKRVHLLNQIDIVLIEKQPSFNPKMRIIAGCLQTYFIIRGIVDAKVSKIKSVDFFSPKHKLKCYNGPAIPLEGKSKYSKTKKMGVLICRGKLNEYHEDSSFIDLFEKSKKKDDLSDCYLQAVTWAIFKKLVPNVKSNTIIPISKNTKVLLKKQIKDYFNLYNDGDIVEYFNAIDFKNDISSKWDLSFPVTIDTLSGFLKTINMKTYLHKKTSCSLHEIIVL